ncbi:MAG: hypothetical protein ACOYLR_07965 [Chlorobium sp.]
MIEKGELLKQISAIEQSDESVIAIYSTHIQHVLRYSTLAQDVQDKVMGILQRLDADLKTHKSTIKKLVDFIVKSGKDVY